MINIGAQLFTLRDYIQNEKDFARTISAVAKMGYKYVQISGVQNFNVKEYRKICDDNDIKIILTHTNQDKVLNQIDQVIEEHKILGANYVGLGSMPGRYNNKEWIKYFAQDYIPVAEKLKENGMMLMYHNHSFEFRQFDGKKNLMDVLSELFPADLLGFTLDTFWVQCGGMDVVKQIEKLSGRLPCVHLKDMKPVGFTPKFAQVGEGNLDFAKILSAFEKAGTKYAFVEQDECDCFPFDALQTSYNNLVKLGYK